jgi:hypothetical protein
MVYAALKGSLGGIQEHLPVLDKDEAFSRFKKRGNERPPRCASGSAERYGKVRISASVESPKTSLNHHLSPWAAFPQPSQRGRDRRDRHPLIDGRRFTVSALSREYPAEAA